MHISLWLKLLDTPLLEAAQQEIRRIIKKSYSNFIRIRSGVDAIHFIASSSSST